MHALHPRLPSVLVIAIAIVIATLAIGTLVTGSVAADPPTMDGGDDPDERTGSDPGTDGASAPVDLWPAHSALETGDVAPVTSVVFLSYSRYDDTSPLDNGVRREVHDAIRQSPGSYVGELQTATGIPRSTLRYHLRILEEERLVHARSILGTLRYYPADEDVDSLAAALDSDATAAVLESVARLEPASVSALAADLDRSPSTVSYHLDRLAEEGLVERERDGDVVRTRLREEARVGLAGGDSPLPST